MKLVMFGPDKGHNIDPFIQLLKNIEGGAGATYITRGKPGWTSSGSLKILSYQENFSQEIIDVLSSEPQLIWIHAGYDIKQILSVIKYKHKKSYVSINIWGEQVPNMINTFSFKGLLYRYAFNKADQIHCNWYGTYELLKARFKNVIVRPWGLSETFFSNSEGELADFTKKFIQNLPNDKFLFFYPKSILRVSGQVELIKAAQMLLSKYKGKFVIYLWVGNFNDEQMREECASLIKSADLKDHVKIVEHPFLPFNDIKAIWSKMNCGIQLAKSDQLSTTFLEPQILSKPFIASNISPYEEYERRFEIDLSLVDLNIESIHHALENKIEDQKCNKAELLKRKEIVKKHFNFEKNILSFIAEVKK